jgi:hypothetical protein
MKREEGSSSAHETVRSERALMPCGAPSTGAAEIRPGGGRSRCDDAGDCSPLTTLLATVRSARMARMAR